MGRKTCALEQKKLKGKNQTKKIEVYRKTERNYHYNKEHRGCGFLINQNQGLSAVKSAIGTCQLSFSCHLQYLVWYIYVPMHIVRLQTKSMSFHTFVDQKIEA